MRKQQNQAAPQANAAQVEAAQVEAAPQAPQAPAIAALPATSNANTGIARAMHNAGATALWGGVVAPLLALPVASALQLAPTMPRKVYGARKGGVETLQGVLPQSGAYFVGFGTKAPPARGDGQGGAASVLANLQARAGVGAGGAVCLRAFVLALFAAGIDASICGGSTRAFVQGGKCKVEGGKPLAPFALYLAPPQA